MSCRFSCICCIDTACVGSLKKQCYAVSIYVSVITVCYAGCGFWSTPWGRQQDSRKRLRTPGVPVDRFLTAPGSGCVANAFTVANYR